MGKEPDLYEEYIPYSPLVSWLIVLGLCAVVIAMAMFLHTMIPDVPRTWDFGALPDTPADSPYSTFQPRTRELAPKETEVVPRQLPPMPWAKPLKPLKPEGYEQTRRFNEHHD